MRPAQRGVHVFVFLCFAEVERGKNQDEVGAVERVEARLDVHRQPQIGPHGPGAPRAQHEFERRQPRPPPEDAAQYAERHVRDPGRGVGGDASDSHAFIVARPADT